MFSGFLDINSILEVELKEEEGSFIPIYTSEEFSGEQNNDDFTERDISEDFKAEYTGSSMHKETKSLSCNTCTDIDAIQKVEKRFQCRICEHSTKRSSDLSRHVKEVHLKYRPYLCGICGYRTYRTYTLRVHMLTVHSEIKSPCCNIKQNANKMEKTFFCSFCHLRTKWAGSLRNHIFAVHMKEKPHNCPICNYKSSARYSVMRHIKAVHMKDKPHSCPLCPYKSTRSDTLKVHIKRLHPANGLMMGNS